MFVAAVTRGFRDYVPFKGDTRRRVNWSYVLMAMIVVGQPMSAHASTTPVSPALPAPIVAAPSMVMPANATAVPSAPSATAPAATSNNDQRYTALEVLQTKCQQLAVRSHGALDIHNRNFCACYATKTLSSMNAVDVEDYINTDVMPVDSNELSKITTECSAL